MKKSKKKFKQSNKSHVVSFRISRRQFVGNSSALTMGMITNTGMFDFASSLFDGQAKPEKKPRIRIAFAHPNVDKYWLGWPGAQYDIKAHKRQYTKVLTDSAKKLGIDLDIIDSPLYNSSTVNTFLENLTKAPPEGILITCMYFRIWKGVIDHIAENRGKIPMVVFSPMGTSFTGHLQATRDINGVFVGATQDVEWLGSGLRMLKTIWDMKNTRICILKDNMKTRQLDVIGTTLHYIPTNRFVQEFKKVETTDEMRAIADYYTREAKKIVEPNEEDILNAAKNYVVARRIMAAENCQGISMDCLPLIGKRQIWPPCLAWLRLRDEGIVAACEADWNAAISSRLTHLLFNRPGFMQDPAPNTVNNTLMGAHCACATKLDGFDKPHEPFILRSHSESNLGVATQVLWRVGQKVTIMKFQGPGSIILGTGRVLCNIDTPPSGGCRTSVEIEVDDVADSRDVKGFHQLFIYGDLENQFKAYCQLAGIKVEHI